jgi:hypothetical protein
MSFRDSSGKEIRKETGMAWKKCESLWYILAKKFKNKESPHGFLYISHPTLGCRSMVTVGEETEDAPNFSAESGT